MKTLKKTLCMVLAVVMVVGVLILPASADEAADKAKDQEADYKTLKDYGIMHGRDGGAEALDEYVRRDEVATIVYRILTGDTTEDGKMAGNYKAAAKNFTDVATTNWAAGFIGYTAESKIFSGREGNKFDPTANVRGDELVKVMLRCLGYGAEDEYTGEGWNTRALYTAQEIGMLAGIDEQMDQPITRGAVSQIVLNAIELPMAVYYNGTYSVYRDASGRPVAPNTPGAKANPVLVEYDSNKDAVTFDKWGAPYYEYTPTITFNHVFNAQPKALTKVTEDIKPLFESYEAATECDVSEEIGLDDAIDVDVFTNGKINKSEGSIVPTHTTSSIGGQGRWTRVFDADENGEADRIVYVDTALARVTKVTAHTEDAAGHVKNPASMVLEIYLSKTNDLEGGKSVTQVKKSTDKTDFTYAKGDFVLVNYIQDGTDTGAVSTNSTVTKTYAQDKNVYILGPAPSFNGKQTKIYYNSDKHAIDNVDYKDSNRFHLDQAGTNGATHTWFKDSKDNLIGAVDVETVYSYGVITNIWWSGDASTGAGKAMASVVYMDGSAATIAIDDMTVYAGTSASTQITTNTDVHSGKATYSIINSDVMTVDNTNDKFFVAIDAATNALMDRTPSRTNGSHNIINGHLFRFTADGDKYDAQEVAGLSSQSPATGNNTAYPAEFGNFASVAVQKNVSTISTFTKINSATKFLIRTEVGTNKYTYTPVTGFENIGKYVASVSSENDYVDLNQDGFADLMYITAAAEDAVSVHTFYTSDRSQNGLAYDTWGVTYELSNKVYTIYGYVDGVYGSIKVADTHKTDVVEAITKYTSTPQFKLWAVIEKNGYVVEIIDLQCATAQTPDTPRDPVGTNVVALGTYASDTAYAGSLGSGYTIPTSSMYSGTSLVAVTGDTNDKFENSILTLTLSTGAASYTYVAGKSIMVGDFDDLEGKIVSVVYSSDNQIVLAYCSESDPDNAPSTTVSGLSDKIAATATAKTDGTVAVTYSEGENEETLRNTIIAALEKAGYTEIEAKLNASYVDGTDNEDTKYTYTGKITVGGVAHTYDIAVTATVYYQVIVACSSSAGVNVVVSPNAIYLDKTGKPATGVASTIAVTITADRGMETSSQAVTSGAGGSATFSATGTPSATEIKGTLDVSGLTSATRATIILITLS